MGTSSVNAMSTYGKQISLHIFTLLYFWTLYMMIHCAKGGVASASTQDQFPVVLFLLGQFFKLFCY